MTTNPQRAETTARVIEAMREIADGLPNMAERVASLAGLEIDDETRASLENALEQYKTTLEACQATIEEIAIEDRLTGQILRAGFEEIAQKAAEIQLPPRPEEIPDALEQTRAILDDAMSEAMRSIEEIMAGVLPTFFDKMAREYRDKTDQEGETQLIGLKIELPRQIENDPRGIAVAVEVSHLATIDNRAISRILTSDERAAELADHFDGQAIALVQHGTGRPLDDESKVYDAFTVTVIHPAGLSAHLEIRPEGSEKWQIEEAPQTIRIMDTEEREKVRNGDYGRMPADLGHFYATYLEAIAKKH